MPIATEMIPAKATIDNAPNTIFFSLLNLIERLSFLYISKKACNISSALWYRLPITGCIAFEIILASAGLHTVSSNLETFGASISGLFPEIR